MSDEAGAPDWCVFEGRVEPRRTGRATYTILPLPAEAAADLAGARRVEGEIAEHPVNLALSRAAEVEGPFLWTGRSLLDRIGLEPGRPVEVRLRAAPEAEVEVPDDLAHALRAGDATAAWEALTPGRQRGALYGLATAKRPETRARRIEAPVAGLGGAA